ncbi:SpoIIE family protein phosphatase [Pseudofrankia sp. DC12]|uniref:PP2C family protein-serine/threonine phosphatase n=1 Tax=Pseudofrankia sp. DC12 TaxID=683315 RepID=UPI0005F798A3|nr:SpoIIE family protein phosphatase [Pseudofrankia sp. DC12]
MRESTGLRHGIWVVVGLAGLAIVATLLLTLYSSGRANHAAAERADRLDPAETLTAQLQTAYVDERNALRGYLMSSAGPVSSDGLPSSGGGAADLDRLDPYQKALGDIAARGRDLRARLGDFPTLLAQIDRVDATHQRWQTGSVTPEIALMDAGQPAQAQALELGADSRDRFVALRAAVTKLDGAITAEQAEAAGRVQSSGDIMLSSFGTIVAVLLAMSALMLILSRRWLLVPINELRWAVNAVAAGRYDTTIPAVGPREIIDLAGNVEAMRAQLVTLVRQNERSWEALAQEGPAVLALRDALTPSSLRDTAGLELLGRVDPAEGELAGDWFDAIELSGGQVAVVVGDVAGHGAASGVFALRLKQLLTAALTRGMEPAAAVQWVVEALGDTGETFATALVALIDPFDGEVVFANAGHPDALVLRADWTAARPPRPRAGAHAALALAAVEERPGDPGGPGGDLDPGAVVARGLVHREPTDGAALDGAEFGGTGCEDLAGEVNLADLDELARLGEVEPLASTGPLMSSLVAAPEAWRAGRLRLGPGDVLFVYTDGLVEARDDEGRLFGRHRLVDELVRVGGRTPAQLLDDVFAAVRRHAPGRPSDDRTAIALSLSGDGQIQA